LGLVGIIDPSHEERKKDREGRLPKWFPRDELLTRFETASPKFSPYSYEVVAAADGAQAYERAQADGPDLIILDLDLPHLSGNQTVLDYGCGAGFLARSVSRHVRAVYAIDLSRGVLECARILNESSNITFLHTTELEQIEDASIDLVYSFAVVQHVTDSILVDILTSMSSKLKKGGRVLLHAALEEGDRVTADRERRPDTTLKGWLKSKYGLNYIERYKDDVRGTLESLGYTSIVIRPMQELCPESFDEICTQSMVYAVK